MSLIKDILSVFKKNKIHLKDRYQEVGDIYTFIFEMDNQMIWKAGQHGIFTIEHVKINKPTRAFSIASMPSEGNIKISTKISSNPSEFKQALFNLKSGMTITMRGPVGELYTPNNRPQLFIAGGIGITPYRAIIKDVLINAEENARDNHLIYLDSRGEFIYKSELDNWDKVPLMKTIYLTNREDMSVNIENFVEKHNNEAVYYIAGPKLMVKSTQELLIKKGINKKNIKKDTFIGC